MLSFQDIYQDVQEQAQDDSATSLILIKRAINQGYHRFANTLGREWRMTQRTFSIVADQQTYQLPEDCVRLKSLVVTIGDVHYPVDEIVDERAWNDLNMRDETSSVPEFFYVQGNDLIKIWPIPSASVADAAEITYERAVRDMAQDDYTSGSVTVAANSVVVTGASTTFTANMVGRTLFITDGSADGIGYKISSYTNATQLNLENDYGGDAGAGKTYKIGEVPDIPEEYHESLIDFALFRYYYRRKNRLLARDFRSLFEAALEECKENYSSKTTSNYIAPPRIRSGYQYSRQDLEVT